MTMPSRWLVCTTCYLRSSEIEAGENWHPGQPATVRVEDDVLYVVPHKPDCEALTGEIERRRRTATVSAANDS